MAQREKHQQDAGDAKEIPGESLRTGTHGGTKSQPVTFPC
jgi:hypothetical protein